MGRILSPISNLNEIMFLEMSEVHNKTKMTNIKMEDNTTNLFDLTIFVNVFSGGGVKINTNMHAFLIKTFSLKTEKVIAIAMPYNYKSKLLVNSDIIKQSCLILSLICRNFQRISAFFF